MALADKWQFDEMAGLGAWWSRIVPWLLATLEAVGLLLLIVGLARFSWACTGAAGIVLGLLVLLRNVMAFWDRVVQRARLERLHADIQRNYGKAAAG